LFFDPVDFIMDSDPALQHKEEVDESRLSSKNEIVKNLQEAA